MREAIDYGVQTIGIESICQLETLKRVLQSGTNPTGKQINVMLRLSSSNQLGMDEETIEEIAGSYGSLERMNIHIKGIHYFRGTQAKIEQTLEDVRYVSGFVERLKKDFGVNIDFIEFGTGMKVDYFNASLMTDRYDELRKLILEIEKTGKNFRLEFGRFIAASCGYYVATVVDVKKNYASGYVILNGGRGHFTYYGSNNGMRTPRFLHISQGQPVEADESDENWVLCGPICNDVIVRSVKLKEVKVGDVFIFYDLGAYSALESMFLFLSRPFPELYYYENGNMRCVRKSIRASEMNAIEK